MTTRKKRQLQEEPADQRAARKLRESVKYVQAAPSENDPLPEDIEVFRYVLARRIATYLNAPQRCDEPVCVRTKLCAGPDMRCQREFSAPSAEEWRRAQAEWVHALQRRRAELGIDD
jgi:hypothetical protein